MYRINRLVALHFKPNDDLFKTEVNHINEIKTDNRACNLEWVTHQYNSNYGTRNERVAKHFEKPVLQYTLDNKFIREWS